MNHEDLEVRWEEILARLLEVYESRPMDCGLEVENDEEVE